MVTLGGRVGRRKRFGVEVKGKGRILSIGLLVFFPFILLSICGNAWLGVPWNGAYTAWRGLGEDVRSWDTWSA